MKKVVSETALRLIGAMIKSSLYLDRCPMVVEIAGFRQGGAGRNGDFHGITGWRIYWELER